MSTEETAEHIAERLDELPRAERVRYLRTFLDRVKQRVVPRETRDEEVDRLVKAYDLLEESYHGMEAERDAWQRRYRERCGQDLGDVGSAIGEVGKSHGEVARLRSVIREAVDKLTNLHCKTKRDQSRLCMAFDALYVEANR